MRSHIYIIILFLIGNVAQAQLTSEPHYRFRHYDMDTGLSSNTINDVLMDRDGWIWLATNQGLDLFDGEMVRAHIDAENTANLPVQRIERIMQDATGIIWGRLDNGYLRFDPKTAHILPNVESYLESIGIKPSGRYRVEIDEEGNLCCFDAERVYYYDFGHQQLLSTEEKGIKNLSFGRKGILAIRNDFTVVHWDATHSKSAHIDEGLKLLIGEKKTGYPKIKYDSHGGQWVWNMAYRSLYFKAPGSQQWTEVKPSEKNGIIGIDVRGITEFEDGTVLLANGRFGFLWIDYEQQDVALHAVKNPGSDDVVSGVYFFRKDVGIVTFEQTGMALGTPLSNHFDKRLPSRLFDQPTGKNPTCANFVSYLLEDSEHNIWIGTNGNGLTVAYADHDTPRHYDFGGQNLVVSLCQDQQGRVWVGTFSDGLYIIDRQKCQHIAGGEKGLASNDIWSLCQDAHGDMWVGHLQEGLQRWNAQTESFEKTRMEGSIHALATGPDQSLLVGAAHGLFAVSTDTLVQLYPNPSITDNVSRDDRGIKALAVDSTQRIWIGTIGGLAYKEPDASEFVKVQQEGEPLDEVVQGIASDSLGQLWVTTERGLLRVREGEVTSYTMNEGMPLGHFSQRAIVCLHDGDLFAGGAHGILVIDPRLAGNSTESLAAIFPRIGAPVPFLSEEVNHSWLWQVLAAIALVLAAFALGYAYSRKRHAGLIQGEPTGVVVDPLTGIRSVDELTEEQLKQVVEKHVGDAAFNIEQMATEMGMSRASLHKRVTTLTGYTPLEYLRRYRLERSRQYLEDEHRSIAEVAYLVGFNSPKLYSRYFKEIYGQLPSEIRQK